MSKVIAVDFDGTLCENKYPEIGKPKFNVICRISHEQLDGAKLILWTCRTGELLENALDWCKERGIYFDAVNENLPEEIERWNSDPRKVGADEYWDDKAVKV